MSGAVEWVRARQPGAPRHLLGAMQEAVEGAEEGAEEGGEEEAGPVADRLAVAGLRALESVIEGPVGRAAASRLLAADALLTYACEAAAEEGPEALAAITARLAPARFERLLGAEPRS